MSPELADLEPRLAVRVQPGDTLVVAVDEPLRTMDVETMASRLEEELPGVKIVVVSARQLMVYRPDQVT